MAKAKGIVVVDIVKALRKNKEKAKTLLPARLHSYLEQRIVIASWYPLEDYVALLGAAGQVLPRDGANVYESMGRAAARSHKEGTYSRFKDEANRQATFALPTREVCDTFTGYNLERMTLLGFDNPTVQHVACRANGGHTCRWELEWKGKGEL